MSFRDWCENQQIATEKDCQAPWSGGRNGIYFRCHLCGYKFKPGDKWRIQYTNFPGGPGGNPKVCEKCDVGKEAIIEEWRRMRHEAETKYWSFCCDKRDPFYD